MKRRNFFVGITAVIGAGVMGAVSCNFPTVRKIFYKVLDRINPASGPESDSDREDAVLPHEGMSVSVETALNSRCTSDYDDNVWLFHWGMFDKKRKLTKVQIEQIVSYAKVPRFTDGEIRIAVENDLLTFIVGTGAEQPLRDWMMVESGMQQQAIGLVCAALGAGYVFNTLGGEGQALSNDTFATVRMTMGAMKPSYNGVFWSSGAPGKNQSGKGIALSDPKRHGTKPLITVMNGLKTVNDAGRNATESDMSQLVWAARGRTPHYYKSDPWGMTIPTYQGINTISEVYCINEGRIMKYINWQANRPAHSLEQIGTTDAASKERLTGRFKGKTWLIVLNKNDAMARALWEIGYQLMNLLAQARALEVKYEAVLLDENQKRLFAAIGIPGPVALFAI